MINRSFPIAARIATCFLAASLISNATIAEDTSRSEVAQSASASNLLDALEAREHATLTEEVPIRLRSGTVLSGQLLVPTGPARGRKVPTILVQTPYLPMAEVGIGVERAVLTRLIRNGYAVVIVNDRGTQWSEGEYHWLMHAREDGLDVLSWIESQPWSDGKVGTIGCSSSAEVELPLAMANPPQLKAAVAMGAATAIGVIPHFADQGIFYMGGVPSFDWAWWYHGNGYQHHPKLPPGLSQTERAALARAFDSESRYHTEDLTWADHLPSATVLDAIGSPTTEFNRLITLSPDSPQWHEYDFVNTGQSTRVPILHIDSWYDTIEVYGTTRLFEYLSRNSPNQYLVVGGTAHCRQASETADTRVGERPIGDARFDYVDMLVRWFDHWLVADGRARLSQPKIQYYNLASSHWVSSREWPVRASGKTLYLASDGHANSLKGDGQLTHAGAAGSPPDQLSDDPSHPVPTQGGGCCSEMVSLDQRSVEGRSDVLVYTSEPFKQPMDIAGYVPVNLYVSSSAPDGDLMVKLVDVYPDGRAFNITDSALRLRYREGINRRALMKPGAIYEVLLERMVVASRFEAGHRLRLEVAGTNFPEYERNLHTGGRNYDETTPQLAQLRIYHDRQHPSRITLPVVR